jgi:hypothetical protein
MIKRLIKRNLPAPFRTPYAHTRTEYNNLSTEFSPDLKAVFGLSQTITQPVLLGQRFTVMMKSRLLQSVAPSTFLCSQTRRRRPRMAITVGSRVRVLLQPVRRLRRRSV